MLQAIHYCWGLKMTAVGIPEDVPADIQAALVQHQINLATRDSDDDALHMSCMLEKCMTCLLAKPVSWERVAATCVRKGLTWRGRLESL